MLEGGLALLTASVTLYQPLPSGTGSLPKHWECVGPSTVGSTDVLGYLTKISVRPFFFLGDITKNSVRRYFLNGPSQ